MFPYGTLTLRDRLKRQHLCLPVATRSPDAKDRRFHVVRPVKGAYNLCDVCTLRRLILLSVWADELRLLGIMTGTLGEGEVLGKHDRRAFVESRSSAKVSFLADDSHCHFARQSRCFIRCKTGLYPPVLRRYQLFPSPAPGYRFSHPQWNPE